MMREKEGSNAFIVRFIEIKYQDSLKNEVYIFLCEGCALLEVLGLEVREMIKFSSPTHRLSDHYKHRTYKVDLHLGREVRTSTGVHGPRRDSL